MKKLLLVDHYDSFTYILTQYFEELSCDVKVVLCDQINLEDAKRFSPDFLVFSPGPGSVENLKDIGLSLDLFHAFRKKIPILGVCLGHQLIAKALGGSILRTTPVHGKTSNLKLNQKALLFQGLPHETSVMRYHSLLVDDATCPESLRVVARTENGLIMAFENSEEGLFGVQFHPESIGTPFGKQVLENFLTSSKELWE